MSDSKKDYLKAIAQVRRVLNEIDPESLSADGAVSEYNIEAAEIAAFLLNPEKAKDRKSIERAVNEIWVKNSGGKCPAVSKIAQKLSSAFGPALDQRH